MKEVHLLTAETTSDKPLNPEVDSDLACSDPALFYERLQARERFSSSKISYPKLFSNGGAINVVAINLIAVILALMACELMTRVLVAIAKPIQFGHKSFDAKFAVASQDVPAQTPGLFFLGASYTNRGVYPELIEHNLRKRGVNIAVKNLACSAAYPAGELLLLKQALGHSSGPTVVVYDIEPTLVQLPVQKAESLRNYVAPYFSDSYMGQCFQSNWPLLKEVDLFLKQNFYLVRYRSLIKSTLLNLTQNFAPDEKTLLAPGVKEVKRECSPRGWSPDYDFIPDDEDSRKRLLFGSKRLAGEYCMLSTKCKFNPENPGYPLLNDVRRFCDENRIPLLLLWMPVHPETNKAYQKQLGLTGPQISNMMHKVAENLGGTIIDAHDLNDEDNFHDGDHLNAVGAIAVSKRISEELLSDRFKDIVGHLQSR